MAKLSEKIYSTTNRLLKEGEEIRAVGQFSSGWHPLVGITLAAVGGALACFTFGISLILSLIGTLIYALATKIWYVSVTNQRVIFTQLSFWGTPDVNKTYSIPLPAVRVSEHGLSVQPVSSDVPQTLRYYFGAKSITGLDKSNFASAFVHQASGSQVLVESIRHSIPAEPSRRVASVEQQEEAKQRKRRSWGWVFVIGASLFTLIGICQTIGTIAYSVSSSAADAVQKSGIIAIVAPLGCNAIWLVLWGVLLGLSIKNLRSMLRDTKQSSGEQAKQNLTTENHRENVSIAAESARHQGIMNGTQLDSILATARSAQWHNPSRAQQMLKPIKDTWGVDCKIVELDKQQVPLIERLYPLDTAFHNINGQYQYRISSNSIFIHPYGSWLNFGYLKFWYSGRIYYVNVAPMVDLTPEFYERSDDLSHIAKIMLALGELDRSDRESVMIILDGELKQEE